MENKNYRSYLSEVIDFIKKSDDLERKSNHSIFLEIGCTPDVLTNLKLKQLSLIILIKTIDKVFYDHGINKSTLENIFNIIERPKAIYKSESVDNSCVLVSFEARDSKPLILALNPNKKIGRTTHYNVIASIYYKDKDVEKRWTERKLLLWKSKSK
jgi:hypothetical protein